MTCNDPFYDWRYPHEPCTWQPDYFNYPHVVQFNQTLEHWRDVLLTMSETLARMNASYCNGYQEGKEDPHYPVPALADTATVLILDSFKKEGDLAWDGMWREELPSIVYRIY